MLKDHHLIRVRLLFLPFLTHLFLGHAAVADVSVNPPQTITHRVVVQPIRVRKNALNIANFMGSVSSEAYIKQQINSVWAQVGVEIEWLDIVDYTNAFAFDGSPTNYQTAYRPTSHLDIVLADSGTPPRSEDSKVLNMFFVRIPAGFNQQPELSAAGIASIDRNGSMLFVGSGMLSNSGNRDIVASVIAHEIGHNLGLDHISDNRSNLMYSRPTISSPYRNGEMIENSQSDTIFTDHSGTDGFDFLQALPPESHYLIWAELNNLIEGPDGDDDDDHLSNAFEFLNGSSPISFTPHPAATVSAQGVTWNLTKAPDAVADGFTYLAESSLSLNNNWLPAGTMNSGSSILEDNDAAFSVLLESGHSSAFLRFDVTIPISAEEAEPSSSLLVSDEATPRAILRTHQRSAAPTAD